jgi:ATP-dependent DNA helicase DinG
VPRRAQIDMSLAVAHALLNPGARLVVEAGTGTGKSLAYLAPALLSGKKVVVATGTKALQDQLYTKDVPLAAAVAADLVDVEPLAVLMKGRSNYLCKQRFERFSLQPTFVFPGDVTPWHTLQKWAAHTETGDRADIPGFPDSYATWSEIDAGPDTCLGQKCPDYDACFLVKMRRAAESAPLLIANHHLVCADQRVRLEAASREDAGMGFAQVIPRADAYILDEAHALPDTATDYFGLTSSTTLLLRLVQDLRGHADLLAGDARADLLDGCVELEEHVERLFGVLRPLGEGERKKLRLPSGTASMIDAASQAFLDVTTQVEATDDDALASLPEGPVRVAERAALVRRLGASSSELAFVLGRALDDGRFVVFVDTNKRGAVSVTAAPIDVGDALAGTLFRGDAPIVLTSATLAVGQDMSAFLSRVGLSTSSHPDAPPPITHVYASPFDHKHRAALYAPAGMPEPEHADFLRRYDEEVTYLLELSRGGVLLLFTSHKGMQDAYARLAATAQSFGMPTFKQGDAPKAKLLEQLRAHDGDVGAVLFATQSFWEGVDVSGRALRLVVVDRLPFRVPSDPVQRARADLCKARGGDPFRDLAVPEAALSLKQGAGRLLRSVDDAGVVAILDGRLRSRPYGARIVEALPPMTRIGSRRALTDFWTRFVLPALAPKVLARDVSDVHALDDTSDAAATTDLDVVTDVAPEHP